MSDYWHGMVVCHRKGLSHITRESCVDMWDETLCDRCRNRGDAERGIIKEREDDEKRRLERKLVVIRGGRK